MRMRDHAAALTGFDRGAARRRLGLGQIFSLHPEPEIIRDEREHPGELIRFDIKQPGCIDDVGTCITGNRTAQGNKRGTGWDDLNVAIDDASSLGFTAVMPDAKQESAVAFLTAAIARFAAHGVRRDRGAGQKCLWRWPLRKASPACRLTLKHQP